jgi:hypothetical protein
MLYSAVFAVSSERVASVVYSSGGVVVFSHDGFWWLLVLDGSAKHDFASDFIINEAENRRPIPVNLLFV